MDVDQSWKPCSSFIEGLNKAAKFPVDRSIWHFFIIIGGGHYPNKGFYRNQLKRDALYGSKTRWHRLIARLTASTDQTLGVKIKLNLTTTYLCVSLGIKIAWIKKWLYNLRTRGTNIHHPESAFSNWNSFKLNSWPIRQIFFLPASIKNILAFIFSTKIKWFLSVRGYTSWCIPNHVGLNCGRCHSFCRRGRPCLTSPHREPSGLRIDTPADVHACIIIFLCVYIRPYIHTDIHTYIPYNTTIQYRT